MGFLDSQLAQGYAFNYSQQVGLLSSEQAKDVNNITNGLQAAESLLGLGMKTRRVRVPRQANPGEYRVDTAKDIRTRVASEIRSASSFEIKPYFRANRVMTREQRYRRDNNIRSNRKIGADALDSWEIRTASKLARRAVIRRIILRRIGRAIVESVLKTWYRRPDLAAFRGIKAGRLAKLYKAWREFRAGVRGYKAYRAYREYRVYRSFRAFARFMR